jgi:hypothetical protein
MRPPPRSDEHAFLQHETALLFLQRLDLQGVHGFGGGARIWQPRDGRDLAVVEFQTTPNVAPERGSGDAAATELLALNLSELVPVGDVPENGGSTPTSGTDFPVEARSVEQLRLLAIVLSGYRFDPVGALVPLEPAEYLAAWRRLRQEMPEACRPTPDEEQDWHRDEIAVAESWGDWPAAERHHRRLVEQAPADGERRHRLANALAEQGRWAEARREYEAAAARLTNPFHARVAAAWVALASGDREQHRRDLVGLLRDHGKTFSPTRGWELLRLAALGSDADAAKRALTLAHPFGGNCPSGGDLAWVALAECRASRPRQWLAALRDDKKNRTEALSLLLRAAVFRQAGEATEAAAELQSLTGKEPPADWREREIARLLRQEAR